MAGKNIRIFQIAKELNISHTEILSFLEGENVKVANHMSPVDETVHQKILTEFAKDKEVVERYRKDQVRKEIQDDKFKDKQEKSNKLKLLSLEAQRKLEKDEKDKAELEEKNRREAAELKIQTEKAQLLEAEKAAQDKVNELLQKKDEEEKRLTQEKIGKEEKKEKEIKIAKSAIKGKKLRKVNLSDIQGRGIHAGGRKTDKKQGKAEDESVKRTAKDRVRQTLARADTKKRKKIYRRERTIEDEGVVNEEGMQVIEIAEYASVEELGKKLDISSGEIIKQCLGLGVLATINQRLNWDVIEILCEENGVSPKKTTDAGVKLFSLEESEEDISQAEGRAPVVTIMGHVDHGKTSLLDFIRETNVVAGESGGITQHIGAYKVALPNDKSVTFLDTPGHEAFTAMRARGAQVTDIVILVVAGNDSVMPQTIEAIDHAKAGNVPMIVVINKMDLAGADADKVKRELSERNVLVEDWGGKVQCIPCSAINGDGIPELLTAILLEAEMLELKANRNCLARGTVIDSRLDKGYGPMATVLIQKGTLKVGDPFICNDYQGKVRSIMDERGKRLTIAYPSDAVQLLGFGQVPKAADIFAAVENERDLKRIASDRQRVRREISQKQIAAHGLDAMSMMIREGDMKLLPLIIKGDVDGSVDALAETLSKIKSDEVGVNVIHKSVGMITESDVMLAEASKAVIIGFHVQVSSNARLQANQAGVEIRSYNIIYNAVEEIKLTLEGLLEPDQVEEESGTATVQTQFKIPKLGFIAGSKVSTGLIIRGSNARVIRDDEILYEGKITSLKRFKDDAKEVKEGMECGIGVEGFSKFEEGDLIQVFAIKNIKRKLDAS